MKKGNGYLSMSGAIDESGFCRTTIYKLITPRRHGGRIAPPRVRSKTDVRGRRLVHRLDLVRVMRSERHRPLTPR
jgi:hypothetical protein